MSKTATETMTGVAPPVLAAEFGCRVHGIDFSRKRFREAQHLTRLVGLDKLVTFECSDLMTARVPLFEFDVLWGQSSWIHIADKKKFIRRWARALTPKGRIALEDAFVETRILTSVQRAMLTQLEAATNTATPVPGSHPEQQIVN